jgi:excisionase family DNA binding protein
MQMQSFWPACGLLKRRNRRGNSVRELPEPAKKVSAAPLSRKSAKSTIGSMAAQRMNVRQTARSLGVSESTVRNWADKGILHATRLPGSRFRRFDAKEIEKVLARTESLDQNWIRRRIEEYRPTLDYLRDH